MGELGFGFLRLPRAGGDYDWDAICAMTDAFLERGGTYFDTCYTYLDGASERAIRDCLVRRHPRESFVLADKLPGYMCRSYADNQRYFDEERRRCGVDAFDVYMLHWLNRENYAAAERYGQFDFLAGLKARGEAGRIGFSYHDSAALLDEILTRRSEIDLVQIQVNYLDWDAAGLEAGKCYDVCVRHGKPIVVMEPIKGGTLAALPAEAEKSLREKHPDWTAADWALRFVRSLPQVEIALSGMSALGQVIANTRPVEPLTEEERQELFTAASVIRARTAVGCTACRYCEPHCPQNIPIPDYLQMYNDLCRYPDEGWKIRPVYESLARTRAKASECLSCGQCAEHCPQHLAIPTHMKAVAAALE